MAWIASSRRRRESARRPAGARAASRAGAHRTVLVTRVGDGYYGWPEAAPFDSIVVTAAAGTVFFSFIGLDTVATAGEEVHNPKRNVPLGILSALVIVTVFYTPAFGDDF